MQLSALCASKGSQKWIQKLVNENQDMLDTEIKRALHLPDAERVEWRSPLEREGYAEYRDAAFLEKLGIDPGEVRLERYWPKGGPRWDALGRTSSGKLLLVEAKSHIPELISTLKAESDKSKSLISSSLKEAKAYWGSNGDFDWSKTFYQYANRLAHLYLLRDVNAPAYLVFVYFLNDLEMGGPSTVDEWKGAIKLLHKCLGVRERRLEKCVADVFIDINKI